MSLEHVDLYRITADIWAALLGLELKPNPATENHDTGELVTSAYVQITGDWTGAVMVQVSATLARNAAAAMFMMEPDEVSDEELADTVGELANVAGGNVKSLLEGSCQLSLPAVTSGRDYQVAILGASPLQRMTADSDGELVTVTLFQGA